MEKRYILYGNKTKIRENMTKEEFVNTLNTLNIKYKYYPSCDCFILPSCDCSVLYDTNYWYVFRYKIL